MGRVRYLSLLLLLVLPLSFAAIIESGDNGADFVEKTAAAKCLEPNTQAVYKCLGNVVRAVSSVPGEGSTFYKPEGKVISCPVVPPSEMGAECLQMMTPNFCPVQAVCGVSPAPEVFPGQNDTPEQVGDTDYYIVPGQAANENSSAEVAPPPPPPKPPQQMKKTTVAQNNTLEAPVSSTNNLDSPLGYLVWVILLLGVAAVGVLFMLFRNSLAEDEA